MISGIRRLVKNKMKLKKWNKRICIQTFAQPVRHTHPMRKVWKVDNYAYIANYWAKCNSEYPENKMMQRQDNQA